MRTALLTYEKDDGPFLPSLQKKVEFEEVSIKKPVPTNARRQSVTNESKAQNRRESRVKGHERLTGQEVKSAPIDGTLALLLGVVLVIGGFVLYQNWDSISINLFGGVNEARTANVSLVGGIGGGASNAYDQRAGTKQNVKITGPSEAFTASVYSVRRSVDSVAVLWYETVCSVMGGCTTEYKR